MGLHAVGLEAKLGIQSKINDGPFDPLAESTLKARAASGKSIEEAHPLVDSGQLRNAVNYVVREK
jgi:hypothetical protein